MKLSPGIAGLRVEYTAKAVRLRATLAQDKRALDIGVMTRLIGKTV